MGDLVKRLAIKAGCIEMGERIEWGSDTALMREAADRIEELEAEVAKAREEGRRAGLEEAAEAVTVLAQKEKSDGH